MSRPQQILEPLTEILTIGLLNIRVTAARGDAQRCHVEAYHLHNLPHLIRDYRPELLIYYLDIEKPSFEKNSSGIDLGLFEQHWARHQSYRSDQRHFYDRD